MEMRLGSLLNRLDFLVGYFMREAVSGVTIIVKGKAAGGQTAQRHGMLLFMVCYLLLS